MNMLKTIRRQMGLAALWVMAGLLAACTDDTFGGRTDRVVEGIPVTVRLGFRASEATPETRAAQGKEYEDRVDNVYILIFDEAGDIHDRFFLTEGDGLTYAGDASKSSGKLFFNTTSLNDATIVGIANLAEGGTSTAYTVTEDELNEVTTLSGLQEKVMTMRDKSVYRSACFMMTGYATTTLEDGTETYQVTIPALESGQTAELQCTLKLERTDAKVKFKVTAESGNEKWTGFSFQPTGWSVKQVPMQSLILPREPADTNGKLDADGDGCTYFESPSYEFEETTRDVSLYTGGSFVFYMPENRKSPKQNITTDDYALRDEREGDAFAYANDHSTYVEITGLLSYFDEKNSLTYANVRFTIHLGYADDDVNDYATLRNHSYTYHVTVRGANDIMVDVEDKKDRPGYDGDVVVNYDGSYQFDSHYDRRLIKLHRSGFLPEEGGTAGTLRWGVSTPFSKGVHEVVADAKNIKPDMRDYRWIKFAVNSEYGVDNDKMVKYPGDQNYNDPFPIDEDNNDQSSPYYTEGSGYYGHTSSHPDARLRDVNQLMQFLKEEAEKTNSTIFDSEGYVSITAFVDENVYTHDPTNKNAEDLTLWKRMAETDDRQLYIIVDDAKYSGDHLSSVIKARYSFRQRSVRTIYNVNNKDLKTAWGLESTMEPEERIWTGSITNGIETTSKDNGRLNTLRILLGNYYNSYPIPLHWTDVLSVEDEYGLKDGYDRAIYACLIRNRDLDGDNVVDADEIRWYLASINQLVDIYLGEYALDEPSRLYPRDAVDRPGANKGVYWHYTSSSYNSATDPWVLWSEEGASVGLKSGSELKYNGGYYSYRCLRNLGLPLDSPDETPDDLVKVTSNGSTYYIDLSRMNEKSRRDNLETTLAAHNEREQDNRPYQYFEVHPNYYPQNSDVYHWTYYQTASVCPSGYRVPNQRELLIMSTRLPPEAWSGYAGHYMSQTAFSLKGQAPYDDNRVGFMWNTGGNFILVNNFGEVGKVRPVRDITSITAAP